MKAPLLLCLALLAGCAHQTAPVPVPVPVPPRIISVQDWGGSASDAPVPPQRIDHITIHHQGETSKDTTDVRAYLQRLQQWSRLTKAWRDIPYHYVIAPDGRIYAGRPVTEPGDTNTEYDPTGHALVMLMGNFEEQQPSAAQLESMVELVAWLARSYHVPPERIASHRDYSQQTVCPGKNLYAFLKSGELERAVAQRLVTLP